MKSLRKSCFSLKTGPSPTGGTWVAIQLWWTLDSSFSFFGAGNTKRHAALCDDIAAARGTLQPEGGDVGYRFIVHPFGVFIATLRSIWLNWIWIFFCLAVCGARNSALERVHPSLPARLLEAQHFAVDQRRLGDCGRHAGRNCPDWYVSFRRHVVPVLEIAVKFGVEAKFFAVCGEPMERVARRFRLMEQPIPPGRDKFDPIPPLGGCDWST